MAASTSFSSRPMTRWGDIPEELKDMMLCHACNLQAYEQDRSVVLPCAHVMCLECVKERLDLMATRDKIECPRCAAGWQLPFGDILSFPKDVFSRVLNNSLLKTGIGVSRPNPKCALHPREDVSRYCKQCSLTACVMCCERRHKEHVVETLESQGARMDMELNGFKTNIIRKISQIGDTLEELRKNQTRMADDFQWTYNKIQEEAQRHIDQLKQQAVKIRQGAHDNVDELKLRQHKVVRQFEQTLKQLEVQKESLENDQLFIDTLYNMGNESDKLSRVPGMKDMIATGKQFSGRTLELETLKWMFDVDKTDTDMSSLLGKLQIKETLVESLRGDEQSLFPDLHDIGTVPISCKLAYDTRSVTLFNQQHIMHTRGRGDNADKICIHNTTGAVTRLISVPGKTWCATPVVVDAAAGEIVAADRFQGFLLDKSRADNHLSGKLHWLTLNKRYDVIKHEVIPMQCVQHGYMNVNHAGHLLVITCCTTSEHPNQVVIYDNNKRVVRSIALPGVFAPMSAVSIDSGKFVVVDYGKHQVTRINQHGQVLHQYEQQPGEKLNDSKLLQYLLQNSDVTYLHNLHLDEQRGLLCVVKGGDINNREVETFQFLPCTTRIKHISLSAQV